MILFLFILLLLVMLKKITRDNSRRWDDKYKKIEAEYAGLLRQNSKLKQEGDNLNKDLERVIALYEITKELSKSLDEDKIFGLFRDRVARYINLKDLKFVKKEADLPGYKDYTIMALSIHSAAGNKDAGAAGYLAVKGIDETEKERYDILAQQFLSGIRRAALFKRVQDLTVADSLTGLLNRRHWQERFIQEIERSIKFKLRFSFFMIDIDHFKEINDKYGHLVGDAVLKEVAKRIRDNARQIDLVCRYGGEEFSVVLIETDKSHALFAAERIRKACEEKDIRVYDENLKVTVSIGVSNFPDDFEARNSLIEKADAALYQAKQSGRNMVSTYLAGGGQNPLQSLKV